MLEIFRGRAAACAVGCRGYVIHPELEGGLDIVWHSLDEDHPLVGKTLTEANLHASTGVYVIAIMREQETLYNPAAQMEMRAGDLIGFLGDHTQLTVMDEWLAGHDHDIFSANPLLFVFGVHRVNRGDVDHIDLRVVEHRLIAAVAFGYGKVVGERVEPLRCLAGNRSRAASLGKAQAIDKDACNAARAQNAPI